MAEKINLTMQAVEDLIDAHEGERAEYRDKKTPGLLLSLRPGGSAVFYFYARMGGRPARMKLGAFPALTVDNARKKAYAALAKKAEGEDPRAVKIARRGELTIGSLFTFYLEQHAKPRKRSWPEDEAQYKRYLKPWEHRKLSTVRKADIQALLLKIGTGKYMLAGEESGGPYAANRLRSLLMTMFNVANDAGWNGANPVRGIKKFPEHKRERFLRADELPKFFASLAEETSATVRDFVKIALLTGARKMNCMQMRWEQLHLDRAEWVIPLTKAGESQTVHLPAAAMEILRERQEDRGQPGPWVFPGRGEAGHLVDPMRIWKRILERAGLTGLRIHDLRRTLGSWQAATGASLPIIGKSLGHKNQATTQIYARLDLDPIRASVDTAAAAILEAANKKPAKARKAKGGSNG